MRLTVKKWGNSASIRIPAAIMEAAQLKLDDAVDVREEGGRIIIEPLAHKTYDIDDLLAQTTGYPFEVRIAGKTASAVLADQVKSLDWRARKARRKGAISSIELAEARAKLIALVGQP